MKNQSADNYDAAQAAPVKVVTYKSTFGATINVCAACESHRPWPKDSRGSEYAQVERGAHLGGCDICGRLAAEGIRDLIKEGVLPKRRES